MKSKDADQAFNKFKNFQSYSKRKTEKYIKQLSINGGDEFVNDTFQPYCVAQGIYFQIKEVCTTVQNRVAEQANCTIVTKSCSMMNQVYFLAGFWMDTIQAAIFLQNFSVFQSRKMKKTPSEQWHGSVTHI